MNPTTARRKKSQTGLEAFEGQWIALRGQRIVDSAKTLHELAQRMRRKGVRKPTVMLVPRKDEGPYILAAV